MFRFIRALVSVLRYEVNASKTGTTLTHSRFRKIFLTLLRFSARRARSIRSNSEIPSIAIGASISRKVQVFQCFSLGSSRRGECHRKTYHANVFRILEDFYKFASLQRRNSPEYRKQSMAIPVIDIGRHLSGIFQVSQRFNLGSLRRREEKEENQYK